MRAKSQKRTEAESLRREQGLSYSEIAALTGVSKSTLSNWLRDIALAPEHQAHLQQRLQENRAAFAARAWPINRERHERARQEARGRGATVAASVPDAQAVHELAFAMLYLGEGAKSAGFVELSSTSPEILRYALWVLRHLYHVAERRITCYIHLIAAAAPLEEQLLEWWGQQIGVDRAQFRKTNYDRRPRRVDVSEDYHGVCALRVTDRALQQHILGLAEAYVSARTGTGAADAPKAKPADR